MKMNTHVISTQSKPVKSVTYANAEVRGKLRKWKAGLVQQYSAFEYAYKSNKCNPLVEDLVKRSSSKGRQRAFDKLVKLLGPGAILEGLRLDGSHPVAIWSLLKPRDSVTIDAPPESGRNQNCVTVNYALAGVFPMYPSDLGVGMAEGLWTLEVPDHALGRAVERSGMLPESIIRDAHHNVLCLQTNQIVGKTFLLRAGGGAFVCELITGDDESLNRMDCHVLARTWIESGQLYDDQVVLADNGSPGERLGDTFLLPAMLRGLVKTSNGLVCEIRSGYSLPNLLSRPQGTA